MNKKMLIGAAAGVLAVLVLAKPASGNDDDDTYEYEALFTVRDTDTSSPVSGAVISIGGASGVTNGSGQATIGLEGPGTYSFEVSCSGYNSYSDSFTFDESLAVTAEA